MDCQDYITESVERKKGQHLQREERGAIQHLKNAGYTNRAISSTSPTDGFADLNWMTPSQITPHSVRPEHENGSKAISFRKPSMK